MIQGHMGTKEKKVGEEPGLSNLRACPLLEAVFIRFIF